MVKIKIIYLDRMIRFLNSDIAFNIDTFDRVRALSLLQAFYYFSKNSHKK